MADQNNDNRGNYFEKREGTSDARYHVVPGEDKRWAVKEEGKDDPVYTTDNKNEAVDEAKKRAEEAGSKAIIHDDEGTIEEQIEYDQ
ncbi:DUF2188 domain-containing protein [Salinicoccus sp. ID82-1]|uniref:DUF2188 domain-containing protein n=1 Tax=Salinicoccus sp. ID82-1 TaxID=2820269 RepID=UPI001F300724|nr:DUF2188 domain-containing protein [Salinicoccus sp. ID82-1]MCG1010789.1 DUF2188 domain-containing protein [Salinicoccus sp. ID82-1]